MLPSRIKLGFEKPSAAEICGELLFLPECWYCEVNSVKASSSSYLPYLASAQPQGLLKGCHKNVYESSDE